MTNFRKLEKLSFALPVLTPTLCLLPKRRQKSCCGLLKFVAQPADLENDTLIYPLRYREV